MPKCSECGLLTVLDEYTDARCEATKIVRDTGQHKSSAGTLTRANVMCLVDSPAFSSNRPELLKREDGSAITPTLMVELIRSERICLRFVPWREGTLPREHEEMQLLQEVQRLNREARDSDHRDAERRHQETLDWQKSVEASIDRRFTVEMGKADAAEKATDRRHHIVLIQQFLLALVAAVIALIGSKLIPWFN